MAEEQRAGATEDRLSLVVFSGTLDRQLAALTLATGAAASGMQVDVFFTFWGLAALRDPARRVPGKGLVARALGRALPRGLGALPLSVMNLGGLGPILMRALMRRKGIASPEELVALSAELGVRFWACDMSRELLGIEARELIGYPHLGHCGVAQFLELASRGRLAMFV